MHSLKVGSVFWAIAISFTVLDLYFSGFYESVVICTVIMPIIVYNMHMQTYIYIYTHTYISVIHFWLFASLNFVLRQEFDYLDICLSIITIIYTVTKNLSISPSSKVTSNTV